MKITAKLSVELEIDMHQGNNWYEGEVMMILTIELPAGGCGKSTVLDFLEEEVSGAYGKSRRDQGIW